MEPQELQEIPEVYENWEMFHDDSYYGMWAVRFKGDTDFNSRRLFHFLSKKDATEFKSLIEKAM